MMIHSNSDWNNWLYSKQFKEKNLKICSFIKEEIDLWECISLNLYISAIKSSLGILFTEEPCSLIYI